MAGAGRRARGVLAAGDGLRAAARLVVEDHARAVGEVRQALHVLREGLVRRELAAIPVSRLKDVTEGRLRVGALEAAGYSNVHQVLGASVHTLRLLPGIAESTAQQTVAAAARIAEAVRQTVAVRIDIDQQDEQNTALVSAVHRLVVAGPQARRAREAAERLDAELTVLLDAAAPARGSVRALLAGRRRREEALAAVAGIAALLAEAQRRDLPTLLAQASADLLRPPVTGVEAWIDFELRSAEFYAVLGEVAEDGAGELTANEGFLPDTLVERVRAEPLDDALCRVSLRGYQAFGARFALAQRRVVLGDEMGLGKTVQAIAVLAHLAARRQSHFLVVCPAGVLVNWLREVESRSTLRAFRLHGPEREAGQAEWIRLGGVAVTTFDGLRRVEVPAGTAVGALVVDEAHYVKNHATQRSQAVARWTGRVERVLFLTGTPMENRVEEFRSLVHYLQPELLPLIDAGAVHAGPQAFRTAVAPAYLRRNRQDVLTELPEVVHVDAWTEFTPADLVAYRDAVAAGNFMAMRRAAYAVPATSAKLRQLREIVREAGESGLKVVVFSAFTDVLAAVQEALGQAESGPAVFGPIAGSTPAARRQELVDEFSALAGHAVLLSQIQAGGVGLNMQAASVVILCEPQLKPTAESQAVARTHRMGQIRRVQVHRLLATHSVDERILTLLHTKQRLFDDYARRSDLAESTPLAIDISDQSLTLRIVEDEQLRLAR